MELWWAGGCQGVGGVFLWMSFLVWVTKIGDVVLAFVVWVWGLGWCAGVGVSVGYVGREDVECPLCFLVQWGGVLVVGFVGGLGVVMWLLELDFVGLSPDLDLCICVVIEFGEWEVPCVGCFLSEGSCCVQGWSSVAGVGGVGCGVSVSHKEFLE